MNIIDDITRNTGIYLLKFDTKIGKYDGYIDKINYRVINITDSEIIVLYSLVGQADIIEPVLTTAFLWFTELIVSGPAGGGFISFQLSVLDLDITVK